MNTYELIERQEKIEALMVQWATFAIERSDMPAVLITEDFDGSKFTSNCNADFCAGAKELIPFLKKFIAQLETGGPENEMYLKTDGIHAIQVPDSNL